MSSNLRPPIVTILGHVDHGKTTLLDYIRKSNVALKEHGGITQHIGAYQIEHEGKKITFIDTPGHAAFEKMRSRGAGVADIAVLVIAIDDGIMPQTVEAIKHIQTAKAAMIVAVNKIDLPGVDSKVQLEKIKKQLSDRQVVIEEYGGEVPLVTLSAKTGEGVDKLLEVISLMAELHELSADPTAPVSGVVIESSLDKFKGAVATILIKNGTLKRGDKLVIGGITGKVRSLIDFTGQTVDQTGPSTPVEVLGLEAVPQVGAILGDNIKKEELKQQVGSLIDKLKKEETALNVVIKADKQGSLEAIEHSLEKFNEDKKMLEIVSKAVGDITDSDVKLASTTKAIIIGFNVKVSPVAGKLAETDHVLIRTYNIIYELLEEVEEVVEGMARPGKIEEILGKAQIIAEFPFGKNEKIAGCRVLEGGISKNSKVKILRGDQVVGETKLKSLRKVKEEINRAEKGQDCGMLFDPQVEFQAGDTVEAFRII